MDFYVHWNKVEKEFTFKVFQISNAFDLETLFHGDHHFDLKFDMRSSSISLRQTANIFSVLRENVEI